jgi:hypothetical protein
VANIETKGSVYLIVGTLAVLFDYRVAHSTAVPATYLCDVLKIVMFFSSEVDQELCVNLAHLLQFTASKDFHPYLKVIDSLDNTVLLVIF